MKRVLFICTGNTCRSAMAEALFRDKLKNWDGYEFRSAGVAAWAGDPISPDALCALTSRGIDASAHRSTAMSPWLADWATDIFVMTRRHYETLRRKYPESREKIRFFADPWGDPAVVTKEVSDPFGRGFDEYEKTLRDMEAALPLILEYLEKG